MSQLTQTTSLTSTSTIASVGCQKEAINHRIANMKYYDEIHGIDREKINKKAREKCRQRRRGKMGKLRFTAVSATEQNKIPVTTFPIRSEAQSQKRNETNNKNRNDANRKNPKKSTLYLASNLN